MAFQNVHPFDAIVFDLLDTVYPWGPEQYGRALDALCDTVARRRPPYTAEDVREHYIEIRSGHSARNLSQLKENDFPAYVLEAVESFGGADCKGVADEAVRAYEAAFADALQLPDGVADMFRRLAGHYKLGALSNYPTSGGIRAALARDGLVPLLGAIVVSAEVGFIKPHSLPFRKVCEALGCSPERVLVVGDTFESDIVGAWMAGMPCVRVRPSASGIEQGRFFNGYIRRWLESQADDRWKQAKPLAELESVLQLESWLDQEPRLWETIQPHPNPPLNGEGARR